MVGGHALHVSHLIVGPQYKHPILFRYFLYILQFREFYEILNTLKFS